MKTTRIILISSFILTVVLDFLLNLVTTYLAVDLQSHQTAIYIGLAIVFIASLGLLLWEKNHTSRSGVVTIKQEAKNGGKIRHSSISTTNVTGFDIAQSAVNGGEIVNSGIKATNAANGSVNQQALGPKSKIEDSDISIQ